MEFFYDEFVDGEGELLFFELVDGEPSEILCSVDGEDVVFYGCGGEWIWFLGGYDVVDV